MSQTECGTGANVGIDTTIILHPKTNNELRILGVNNAQIPGFTTETIPYDPFDKKIAGLLLGSSSYEGSQFQVYTRSQDPSQEELKILAKNRTQFSDIWIMYNDKEGHFWALDLATEPCGLVGFAGYSPQSYGRNDLQQAQFSMTVTGASGEYEYHTQKLVYSIANGVVTAPDADFINQGFKPGMSLYMETGDPITPFKYGIVKLVTATTITLTKDNVSGTSLEGQIHGAPVMRPEDV